MALGQTAGRPRVSWAKKFMFASKHRKYKLFPLVNRWVVPGLSRLSKSLCVQSLCAFFLPYQWGRDSDLGSCVARMLPEFSGFVGNFPTSFWGNLNGGLSKRGLGPKKGATRAQKGPLGGISVVSRSCEVRRNWSRSAPPI